MEHDDYISEGYALDESGFECEIDGDDDRFDFLGSIYDQRRAKTIERRKFNAAVSRAVEEKLRSAGVQLLPKKEPSGLKTEVSCKCCGDKFFARVADRKRGWAKFCSKSCKAKWQFRH